jgi:uncharacterized protein (UPF0332 family)
MKFNWREYFNLAQELTGQTTTTLAGQEARQRAALSRAYYAAFCEARNHLRDKEGHSLPAGGQIHVYVRDQFLNSMDPVRNRIGHDLNRLRIDRNKVDYDDLVPTLNAMTARNMTFAQRVLSELAKL